MLNFLRIFMVMTALMAVQPGAAASSPDADVSRMGEAWAALKYQTQADPEKLAKVRALKQEAVALSEKFPTAAGFLYWRAQILCLEAELIHSAGSLDRMREARDLLEKADTLDPRSSATKSLLGSVHYEVPGWPLSFGSNKAAAKYLREALALDQDGMDPNFFMGDFLLADGHADEAMPYLEKADIASRHLPQSLVVAGRRTEIAEAIAKARKRLGK
jgi:tetratricopeptide (TPR) repeat protein